MMERAEGDRTPAAGALRRGRAGETHRSGNLQIRRQAVVTAGSHDPAGELAPAGSDLPVAVAQRCFATLKLSPLLGWLNVARPADVDELVQPRTSRPARARKPAKSAEAVPQAMFGLETR